MAAKHRPARAGPRHREEADVEFGRIVAFSDGVFAIAITLLVLNLEIPQTPEALSDLFRESSGDFFAYAVSFAVLGRFWVLHHNFFSDVERFDHRLMAINLVYLAWVTVTPFATGVFGDLTDEPEAIAIYAGAIAALSATGALMRIYALRAGLMYEDAARREPYGPWSPWRFAIPIVFLASIPVAYISPDLAPLVWLGSFLVGWTAPQEKPESG